MIVNIIITTNLPVAVKALTTVNDDDSYTIIINKNLDNKAKVESLMHEIAHIKGGDFYTLENVNFLEEIRHKKTNTELYDISFFYHFL